MQFTTVRSKEKDYDIYLKSEKLVHSQQEHEKNVPSYLEHKHCYYLEVIPAIWKTGSQLFHSLTNTVGSAIWREKKNVDPCYLETKKYSSQRLGARKKIMTSI